jgi:hypothetical protein
MKSGRSGGIWLRTGKVVQLLTRFPLGALRLVRCLDSARNDGAQDVITAEVEESGLEPEVLYNRRPDFSTALEMTVGEHGVFSKTNPYSTCFLIFFALSFVYHNEATRATSLIRRLHDESVCLK